MESGAKKASTEEVAEPRLSRVSAARPPAAFSRPLHLGGAVNRTLTLLGRRAADEPAAARFPWGVLPRGAVQSLAASDMVRANGRGERPREDRLVGRRATVRRRWGRRAVRRDACESTSCRAHGSGGRNRHGLAESRGGLAEPSGSGPHVKRDRRGARRAWLVAARSGRDAPRRGTGAGPRDAAAPSSRATAVRSPCGRPGVSLANSH